MVPHVPSAKMYLENAMKFVWVSAALVAFASMNSAQAGLFHHYNSCCSAAPSCAAPACAPSCAAPACAPACAPSCAAPACAPACAAPAAVCAPACAPSCAAPVASGCAPVASSCCNSGCGGCRSRCGHHFRMPKLCMPKWHMPKLGCCRSRCGGCNTGCSTGCAPTCAAPCALLAVQLPVHQAVPLLPRLARTDLLKEIPPRDEV